jgi:hypothetical protein
MSVREARKKLLEPVRRKINDASKQVKDSVKSLPDSAAKDKFLNNVEKWRKDRLKDLDRLT